MQNHCGWCDYTDMKYCMGQFHMGAEHDGVSTLTEYIHMDFVAVCSMLHQCESCLIWLSHMTVVFQILFITTHLYIFAIMPPFHNNQEYTKFPGNWICDDSAWRSQISWGIGTKQSQTPLTIHSEKLGICQEGVRTSCGVQDLCTDLAWHMQICFKWSNGLQCFWKGPTIGWEPQIAMSSQESKESVMKQLQNIWNIHKWNTIQPRIFTFGSNLSNVFMDKKKFLPDLMISSRLYRQQTWLRKIWEKAQKRHDICNTTTSHEFPSLIPWGKKQTYSSSFEKKKKLLQAS